MKTIPPFTSFTTRVFDSVRLKTTRARVLALFVFAGVMSTAVFSVSSYGSVSQFLFGGTSKAPTSVNKRAAAATTENLTLTIASPLDGTLTVARTGHSATVLSDGKVLIVGGENQNGFVTEAEIFDPATESFSISGNLNTPRADHTATRLADGRVLIAGGRGNLGSLNTTEIFDPTSGAFTNGPSLNSARSGQSATALSDGRIILAGGDAAGSVETLDPTGGTSAAAGNMIVARSNHSAAQMLDGRILLVGGRDAGGNALSSGEIFNPADGSWSVVNSSLTLARVRPHLRVLFDGKVQIIGGNSDVSMEIYDPVADVIGAYAHVIPDTDTCPSLPAAVRASQTRAALFFSGSADLVFDREGHTLTELANGTALIAGGSNASGTRADSSVMPSSAAAITTDKLDYAPGQTVTFSGTGYDSGETVRVVIHEDPKPVDHIERILTAVADENGNVTGSYQVEDHDRGVRFVVTARGLTSGLAALTTFTDAVTLFWRGCVDTAWTNPVNWRTASGSNCVLNATATYPGAAANDVANIQNVATQPTISSAIPNSLQTINLPSGTTLTVAAGGSVTSQNDLVVLGTLNQTGGTLTIASGKKLVIESPSGAGSQSGGTLTTSIVEIKSGRTFSQSGTGLLVVTGSSREWKNEGIFNSTGGRVRFDTGATWNSPTSATNQFFDVEFDSAALSFQNNQTVSVRGDWQNDVAGLSIANNSSTVVFNGTGSQQITGSADTSFRNITINKTGGSVTLTRNMFVGRNTSDSGTLTFTQGNIVTGVNKVTVRANSSVSRTDGHVEGNLEKAINIGGTGNVLRTFEVGTGTNYTPINVALTAVTNTSASTTTNFLMGSSTAADHPSLAGSGINPSRSANRYWSLTKTGTWTFTNYDVTATFVVSDVDAGATPTSFQMRKFNAPSTWTAPPGGTTAAALSTTGNDYTGFSDYAVGETNSAPTATAVTIDDTTPEYGQTLTGNYTYNDADSDAEGTSTFRWLRSGTTVVGTNQSYIVQSADIGFTLTFEVTPVAATGASPGAAVQSAATSAVSKAGSTTTVTCASGSVYTGSAIEPCTYTVTGNEAGNPVLVAATAVPSGNYTNNINAGVNTASASFTFTGDTNHNGSNDTENFSIDKVTLSVNADHMVKTFGQSDPTPTWSYSGFVNSEGPTPAGLSGAASCSYASHSNNVGTYNSIITCNPGTLSSTNYDFATGSLGNLTINAKDVTVTAENKARYYGQSDPPFTFTVYGLVAPDTTLPGVTCGVTVPHTNAGTYTNAITCSGNTNTNYNVTAYNPGTLTVNPDPTAITLDSKTSGANFDCVDNKYTATLKDTITNQGLGGVVLKLTIGTQSVTDTTDSNGLAEFTLTLNQPVGTKTESVEYVSGLNANYVAPTTVSRNFLVTPDVNVGPGTDATSLYTGSNFFWTTSSTSSTATLTLSATIKDTSEECAGLITTANVSFLVSTNGSTFSPVSNAQNLPVGLVDPTNRQVGTASAISQYNIGSNQSITLTVRVVVGGQYSMTSSTYDTLITIGKPGVVGSLMGGGKLKNDGIPFFASGYFGLNSISSDFGTQVLYNKKGVNPQGQVTVNVTSCNDRFGNLEPGCTKYTPEKWHRYFIKSNSISELSLIGGSASFGSKTNVSEVLADGSKVGLDGGNTMQLIFTPFNQTAPAGSFVTTTGVIDSNGKCTASSGCASIVIFRSAGGVWYSSSWGQGSGTAPRTYVKKVVNGTVVVGG